MLGKNLGAGINNIRNNNKEKTRDVLRALLKGYS